MGVLIVLGLLLTEFSQIPITVMDTWQPGYASEILDLSFDSLNGYLLFRSNSDGVIYYADPVKCSYKGELSIPAGASGFGMAFSDQNGGYYFIDNKTTGQIMYSNGSGDWNSFENPLGYGGSGMSFNYSYDSELFQITSEYPWQIYSIGPDTTEFSIYDLPGVTGEISGCMVHDVCAEGQVPPALVVTTRFTHEFLFYGGYSGQLSLYAQENCPLTVLESLGLACDFWHGDIYWSYLGTDSLYYISKLYIPIFGAVEDHMTSVNPVCNLTAAENPASGSAQIVASMPLPACTSLY